MRRPLLLLLVFACLITLPASAQRKVTAPTEYDDIKVFLDDWLVQDPDTHEIWESASGIYGQLLTKGDAYWLRTISAGAPGGWITGTLFSSAEEQTGAYVLYTRENWPAAAPSCDTCDPATFDDSIEKPECQASRPDSSTYYALCIDSLDANAIFPLVDQFAQTVTYGKWWFYRPGLSAGWNAAGLLESEFNTAELGYRLDTSTVYTYQGALRQTVTRNNLYWTRTQSGAWTPYQLQGINISDAGHNPLRTHAVFTYDGRLIEMFTTRAETLVYDWGGDLTSVYHFDLDAQIPANPAVTPKLFGNNFVWPFTPYDADTGQVIDQEVDAAFSSLGEANFYRFPGGHWSEWYQWYWGIGPQGDRPWVAIPPARQPLPNTFGTLEFLQTMQSYGSDQALFIFNYLSSEADTVGIEDAARRAGKWVEFVNGAYPSAPPGTWSTEDWRSQKTLTLASEVLTDAKQITVTSVSAFLQDNPVYTSTTIISLTCAVQAPYSSIDGYGQEPGCNNPNRYEWKKTSIRVGDEWMIVDAVNQDTNTLYVRRSDEIKAAHPATESVMYWQYHIEMMPDGYFAWLRHEYEGPQTPYAIQYWEAGNEPFFAKISGKCNSWFPCVDGKEDPATYDRFYRSLTEYLDNNPYTTNTYKMGLPVTSILDFSGGSASAEPMTCDDIFGAAGSWNQVMITATNTAIDFVSPHFYAYADEIDLGQETNNFPVITTPPDKIVTYLSVLNDCLTERLHYSPEVIPNEFGLVYHHDGPYGWWKELCTDDDACNNGASYNAHEKAGKWRDGLFLASLLARFARQEEITAANYWHLTWPGFLGKTGDAAYPFENGFSSIDFTQTGPSFEVYRRFAQNIYPRYFIPELVYTKRTSTPVLGGTENFSIEPLIVFATESDDGDQYSVFIINRAAAVMPAKITVKSGGIGTNQAINVSVIAADAYSTTQTWTTEATNPPEVVVSNGWLTYSDDIPARSIVILRRPLTHTLAVEVVGQGTVTRNPDQTSYDHGHVVTLTAAPAVNWYFQGWSGDAGGALTQTQVTLDANKLVTATFMITPITNHAPTANAGADQTLAPGAPVTLDGSGSADPDGDALTYGWAQIAGPSVDFTATISRTPFIAPAYGILTFTLTVTDGGGMTDADAVMVTVTASPSHRIFLPLVLRN